MNYSLQVQHVLYMNCHKKEKENEDHQTLIQKMFEMTKRILKIENENATNDQIHFMKVKSIEK